MCLESRCHDHRLTPRTIFIQSTTPRAEGAPLRLLVPAVPQAFAPLLTLARTCIPGAREIALDADADGPDAEAALIDCWSDMREDERSLTWGIVGPLAGVLARFTDLPTIGCALLSSTEGGPTAAFNPQARSILMAGAADSWSLALDPDPPVDADAWRRRLSSVLDSTWRVGRLEEPDDAAAALADVLSPDRPALARVDPAPVLLDARNSILHGDPQPTTGWLDRELVARGTVLARTRPDPDGSVQPPAAVRKPGLSSKVIKGRRGRLFLTRDSHDSHRQIVGARPLTTGELDAWAVGTRARLADLSAIGSRYRQLIGPAPQAVHPDDLPEGSSVAADRPVQQVLARLSTLEPRPQILYPLDALRDARVFRDPFSKTDSHWNDLGTFLAYEAILDSLGGGLPVRRLARSEVSFHETCYIGDLGSKLSPERASIFLRARVDSSHARLVEDNRVRNHGRRAVFTCDEAPPTTCLVFGDSWAYSLMLFLAESFRRVVFCHRVNVVDRAPVRAGRPDLVLSVMTERFCTALPLDHDAADFEEVARKKLGTHDVVPEPMPHERHPFLFSLALDRGLPDRPGLHLPDLPRR